MPCNPRDDRGAYDAESLIDQRANALNSWSLLLNQAQAEGLRKWVLYGDLTDVADVHRGLVDEWERRHARVS